ncbi:MAG: glycosyltransferase family 4 protein [Candidatus Niyogibacteria bacterium]|nr:glycosyltransferase family 4 protein [Candidatus Niyogibacteria bacterium]
MADKKKKIIFVITRSHWGGAQRYLYDLAVHLPKNEFDVMAVIGNSGPLADRLGDAGIPVELFEATREVRIFQELKTFFRLLAIFRNERPDIVHLNSSKIGGIGAVAAWLMGVPKIVFTVHGWGFHEDRPMLQKLLIYFFSWLSSLFHHHIICVSDSDRIAARKLPFVHKKCITIRNALTHHEFIEKALARDFFKKQFHIKIPARVIWIGTIAELIPNKGLHYLINALSAIPKKSWISIIIGEGKERAALEKEIRERGLENTVFLAGHIDNASQYLKAFDIFVLPSTKEGSPYALLEAGHASLPVIASEVGGVPEIIHGGKTGLLFPAKNEKMLASHIKTLIENAKFRKHFGEALHKNIGEDFVFEIMLSQTTEVYKKTN